MGVAILAAFLTPELLAAFETCAISWTAVLTACALSLAAVLTACALSWTALLKACALLAVSSAYAKPSDACFLCATDAPEPSHEVFRLTASSPDSLELDLSDPLVDILEMRLLLPVYYLENKTNNTLINILINQ